MNNSMEKSKISEMFRRKKNKILSIYFTAGFPELNSTNRVILALQKSGVDMIEVGIPFSDPLADGRVIQQTSMVALSNGMTLNVLFNQLASIKDQVKVPLVLMGYLNPILKYGIEKFCFEASQLGISGVIVPDIPLDDYIQNYRNIFEFYRLPLIFLITPSTPDIRIRLIDSVSKGFIYAVSSLSTTGKEENYSESHRAYLSRISSLNLRNPILVGFGIHDEQTFNIATQYCHGAIIGSAYLKCIANGSDIERNTELFISKIKGNN